MASSCLCSRTQKYLIVTLLLVFSMYLQNPKKCGAFQTFDFEMHHRFSDQVKAIMGGDNLPEVGSREYYAVMANRGKVSHGRALAEDDDDDSKLLTLSNGEISHAASLGTLHYANISLGTPSLSFLVALDTGTKLLWVPCVQNVITSNPGAKLNLNIYDSTSSSTSKDVSCNSSLCELKTECSESSSQCPYKVAYNGYVNSSGVLVEDVLRLKTDGHNPKGIDARITFGCGKVQTGYYLDGIARNGLFGLGIGNTSVPSILSSLGLVADSFSMCFGFDGVGKISFGDKGSSGQAETPFNIRKERPRYNISVSQLRVGGNLSDLLDFGAVVYSGTDLTQLNEPAYTVLCESFDSQTIHKRHSADPDDLFEYCYDVSSDIPNVTFIMKGGSQFNVYDPMVPKITNGTVTAHCLGVFKNPNGNFIGHNFLTGHQIVFDREKMVLGWKASNCTEGDFVNGGNPKNGSNSNKAPEFLVGKPRNLYLIASLLIVLFLPILKNCMIAHFFSFFFIFVVKECKLK
ncbi:hypothetical protein MKW92_030440 [Papaver armeniacum]|nr:hypothetical protein MKW92_030440 [Papaver armeniacum]